MNTGNRILHFSLKIVVFLIGIFLFLLVFIAPLDRREYNELSLHKEITKRLDSLSNSYIHSPSDSFKIGFSKVSITPIDTIPLAGYSGRTPKEYTSILDSVFVRTIVMNNGLSKAAIISAELLIIHPDVANKLYSKIKKMGWTKDEIYLSATHTHSSIGGWFSGFAGEYVGGDFNAEIQDFVVEKMVTSLMSAQENLTLSKFAYANSELGIHVKNRLIRDGDEDDQVKNLFFQSNQGVLGISIYAAHATCFNSHSNYLTGDYPSYFHRTLENENIQAIFLAGAVGSMGPEYIGKERSAEVIGHELASQAKDLQMIGLRYESMISLNSFQLPVPIRKPQLKITKNLKMREWLFRRLVGDYEIKISVLKINNTLLIGTPCDFSGEVALPLYEYASEKGLNLIITSFNGGYMGYVTKDEHYDEPKYETRTMNWHGPGSGAYFSDIIRSVIETVK